MSEPKCGPSRASRSRQWWSEASAFLATGLAVFALHDWYHDSFAPALGLSRRVADTAGILAIVVGLSVWYRLFPLPSRRDPTPVGEGTRRCPACEHVKQEILPELRNIPKFNQILGQQLRSVVEQTEMAAFDITSRLTTIDEVVTELQAFVARTSAETEASTAGPHADPERAGLEAFAQQPGQQGGSHEQLGARQHAVLARINQSSQRVADMFVDAVASVQFQDVTRQQIEHVVEGLARLEAQAGVLIQHVDNAADAPGIEPLAKQIDDFYDRYVMNHQRDTHRSAVGALGIGEKFSAAGASASAGGSKVELF